jgi:hypothetical protein
LPETPESHGRRSADHYIASVAKQNSLRTFYLGSQLTMASYSGDRFGITDDWRYELFTISLGRCPVDDRFPLFRGFFHFSVEKFPLLVGYPFGKALRFAGYT